MLRIDVHLARLKARGYDWPIPWPCVEDIGRREDCRLTAYLCPAGVWTIGWGETEGVRGDMRWSEEQADSRFFGQISRYVARILSLCTAEPNENQLGAFVSLAYNVGLSAFAKSTVMRQHNAGDFDAAARAFALWNKARVNGQLQALRGLTLRRAAEAAMYLTPIGDAPASRMPQAVEPESSLSASPIARGGAVTAGAGVVTGATTFAGQLDGANTTLASVKGFADQVVQFVGLPPSALLAMVLVGTGWAVWHWRKKQRDGGWA